VPTEGLPKRDPFSHLHAYPQVATAKNRQDTIMSCHLRPGAIDHEDTMSDPVFLPTSKAAARVNAAPSTFEKMRVRGDGPPYIRITARKIVYAVDALDSWARARTFSSTSEYVNSK
jgi:hypothetical protein